MQTSPEQRGILTPGEFSAVVAARLSGKVAMVYFAIALHADRDGICWPGRKLLAEKAQLHPDHVSNAITILIGAGLIEKRRVDGKPGFRLLHHAAPETTESGSRKLPNSVAQRTVQGTSSLSLCDTQKSEPDLAAVATLPPDAIPAPWLEEAQQIRPDLAPNLVASSAIKFLDHHRAKGTRLADWRAAWRNWIRRERACEPAARARQTAPDRASDAHPVRSRYHPTQPNKVAEERTRKALAASEANRQKLLRERGIVEASPAVQGAVAPADQGEAFQGAALVVDQDPAPADQGEAFQGAALVERQAAQGAVAHVEVEALARNLAGAMRIPSPRIAPPRAGREIKPSPRSATMSRDERRKLAVEFGVAPERLTGQFKQPNISPA